PTNDALTPATCTAGCATATPIWVITTVDRGTSGTGRFTSLQLNGGNPVISYRNRNGDVKLATCTAGCATASRTWVITTVDSAGSGFTSMQFYNRRPVVSSYHPS